MMAAMAAMAAVTASTTAEGAEKVSSPDGRLTVTIDAVDGMPVYEVEYDGEKILGRSPLGFRSNVGDFSKGVTIASSSTGSVERSFDQDRIKKSHIDYKANRLSIGFKNETGKFDMHGYRRGSHGVPFPRRDNRVHDPAERPDDCVETHQTEL